ncbi:MAG: hypothetical protein J7L95_03375 [Prolixibacteraceae bacterium]|nr:hypothetical protein [Prolixibacteraceae bacterium]
MKSSLFILLILLIFLNESKAEKKRFISPDDHRISFNGALFIKKSAERVILSRHSADFLKNPETFTNAEKANTQSGVTISFASNSSEIIVHFEERKDAQHRQKVVGIFKNGKFYQQAKSLTFTIFNQGEKKIINWKIVLPSFCGVNFTGLEIDNGSNLQAVKSKHRPVYVAIGNSITHGVGQNGASYLTYPFLLAQQKNWQLYNLAVGGSKISWPVADLLKNIRVDFITILWGYNDWNSTFTIEKEIKPYYKKLLIELRKVQPKAKIYCILPTTSKRTVPKIGTDSLEDIRLAEKEVIVTQQLRGDSKLFIINGKEITGTEDLHDDVHFSIAGAANFAKQLNKYIN